MQANLIHPISWRRQRHNSCPSTIITRADGESFNTACRPCFFGPEARQNICIILALNRLPAKTSRAPQKKADLPLDRPRSLGYESLMTINDLNKKLSSLDAKLMELNQKFIDLTKKVDKMQEQLTRATANLPGDFYVQAVNLITSFDITLTASQSVVVTPSGLWYPLGTGAGNCGPGGFTTPAGPGWANPSAHQGCLLVYLIDANGTVTGPRAFSSANPMLVAGPGSLCFGPNVLLPAGCSSAASCMVASPPAYCTLSNNQGDLCVKIGNIIG